MQLTTIKKIFSIDLNKFIFLHDQVQKDAYNQELDQVFYAVKEFTCNLKSEVTESQFDKYLESLLNVESLNSTDPITKNDLINTQKSELLYLYHIISSNSSTSKAKPKSQNSKLEMLKRYIDLLKLKEDTLIKPNGKIKLSVEAKRGKANILLDLPQLSDNKALLNKLVDEIILFNINNFTELGWYLRLKKKQLTIDELEDEYQKAVHRGIGRKVIGVEPDILLILKMIRTFPQFPNSNRKNSILSEAQGSFIQRYLHLFGINDNSFIVTIDTSDLEYDITYNKKLRRHLKLKS